jgi:hypothetical protein
LIASYAVPMVNPCDIWGFVVEIKMESVKDLCNLETTVYIMLCILSGLRLQLFFGQSLDVMKLSSSS